MATNEETRMSEYQVAELIVRHGMYGRRFELRDFDRLAGCFCYVLRGHCVETQNGKAYEMPTAALVYHPLGRVRSFLSSDLDCISMHFPLPMVCDRLETRLPLDRTLVMTGPDAISLGTRLLQESRRQDAFSRLALEGLLLEMAALSARQTASPEIAPKWLVRAKDLLRESAAGDLTLDALAREVGAHPVHLSRSFRRCFGLTVSDYARQVRLQKACKALANPALDIADIAFDAGFADHSQFSRHFKQAVGMTPSEYRRLTC